MGNLLLIYRKEMRSYFALPIGWVLLIGAIVLFGLMTDAACHDALRSQLTGPVFLLTGFQPPAVLRDQPVLLVVGFARVMAMILIPMVAMRLFPEERQMRTMEMLLTSPVTEAEIVLGKWLGALTLYLMAIAVSLVELVCASPWRKWDWNAVLITFTALAVLGGGLLSIGEYTSTVTRHQSAAAGGSLLICVVAFRYFRTGLLSPADAGIAAALAAAGWFLALRSIRAWRSAF